MEVHFFLHIHGNITYVLGRGLLVCSVSTNGLFFTQDTGESETNRWLIHRWIMKTHLQVIEGAPVWTQRGKRSVLKIRGCTVSFCNQSLTVMCWKLAVAQPELALVNSYFNSYSEMLNFLPGFNGCWRVILYHNIFMHILKMFLKWGAR